MFYLIGKSLAHSYSAEIHRAFGRYDYALQNLPPEAVGDFLKHGEWEGLNVTIPYKQTVLPFLDEISEEAKSIGSVNTIVRSGDRLVGHNTDYLGFFAMAYRAGILFGGRKVVILGSGGTCLTASAVARDCGAREIVVISRTGETTYDTLPRHYDAEILINTTPVGMYPSNGASAISLTPFQRLVGVIDVIYNPLETPILREARLRGIASTGGLYMLVAQAAVAAGHFCGDKPEKAEIDAVYKSILQQKANIVLLGMPGVGKSTVARALAAKTGREILDTDQMIETRAGMAIPEIFKTVGEAKFRDLECEAIAEAGKQSGKIIATGGGAVLREENLNPLTQNGRLYFLLRPLDTLARDNRPLSQNADLAQMYQTRLPLYLKFSDATVENKDPDTCADEILEEFCENIGYKRSKP